MKRFMVPGILLVIYLPGYSQTFTGLVKEHSISIGKTNSKLQDPFILSSPARGNGLQIGYTFSRYDAAEKQSFSVCWNSAALANGGTGVKTNGFQLRFSQGFSLMKGSHSRFRIYTGYSLQANPVFIKADNKQDKRYSWSTVNNLSVYQSVVYAVGKNQWALDVYVPVIGLASRPGEKSTDHNTLEGLVYDSYSKLFITSWHNEQAMSASLRFSRELTERWRAHLGAGIHYNSLQAENDYSEKRIGLSGGISWMIK